GDPTDHSPRTSGHTPLSSGHASPSAGHASPSTGPTHYPLGPAPRTSGHAPRFSVSHPMIPRFYVLPWKQDMKNQRLLLQNAALAQIPLRPLEESLCLCSRERLCHAQKTPLRPHPSPGLSPGPGPSPSPGPDLVQSGLRAHHSSQFSRYKDHIFYSPGLVLV
uniref:Testis expressed 43 n=1 Tax=Periophthalmus magnuspinnatus TaxID=409849 RepID=A0A3B3ZG63_9GOBI